MVERQIAARGIRDERVLSAMREVPREAFVPENLREFAHDDTPLPISEGQTISQPYIVALMAEAAGIGPLDRVLDVGTGSGYAAAVLSRLAERVYSIERHASLAEAARQRLEALGYTNVEVRVGDGSRGWPEAAPFDAILVAAGAPDVPDALKRQLAIGGRLVIPVGGEERSQRLLRLRRTARTSSRRTASATSPSSRSSASRAGTGRATRPRSLRARRRVPRGRSAASPSPCPRSRATSSAASLDRVGGRPRRPARRGLARHRRVLPRPRPAHPPADRGARLHDRGRRGRLAGRGADRPLRPRPRGRPARGGARLRPLPDLDVAQHGGARLRRLAAPAQPGRGRPGQADRLLRPRPLQPERLRPRGARLPGPRGPRARPPRPRALRLPHPLAARPGGLRAGRHAGGLPGLRAEGRGDAPGPAAAAASTASPTSATRRSTRG